MGKREQIDLDQYRQPAAEAYVSTIIPDGQPGMMGNDYVRGLLAEAYLAGVASIAPEGTEARWEHTLRLSATSPWPSGLYRQRNRAINEAARINRHRDAKRAQDPSYHYASDARPQRRIVLEGGWQEL